MSTPAAQVARTYVAPGTVWDVARNRDHTTGAGKLLPQDLAVTTDRLGVWLQWTMLAGFPVAHGEVADEAAMLALHTFGMDSADNPSPRYVAPGDSCTRADDPGWRWHCIAGHGTTIADWERRPLAGALTAIEAGVAGAQPLDADLTAIAAQGVSAYGLARMADSGATAAKNALGITRSDIGGASAAGLALMAVGTPSTARLPLIHADNTVTLIDVPSGGGGTSGTEPAITWVRAVQQQRLTVAPDTWVDLAVLTGAGAINKLWLALDAGSSGLNVRNARLRCAFNGAATPQFGGAAGIRLQDLFGPSLDASLTYRTPRIGVSRNATTAVSGYLRVPMPFADGARLQIRANSTPATSVQSGGIAMAGSASYILTASDSANTSPTGDLEWIADVALSSWTTHQTLVSKWLSVGSSNRSFGLEVDASGKLLLFWSSTGADTLYKLSTVTTGWTAGSRHKIRARLDVDNGSGGHTITFEEYTGGSWVAIGTPVVTAGTTSVYNAAARTVIGAGDDGAGGFVTGTLYELTLNDSIGGTPAFTCNPSTQPDGTAAWVATTGETWSVAGGATGALQAWCIVEHSDAAARCGDLVPTTDQVLHVDAVSGTVANVAEQTILDRAGATQLVGFIHRMVPVGGSTNYQYLEGDYQVYVGGESTPSYRTSGTEDAFDSSYYFNEGAFQGAETGVLVKSGGTVSAYRCWWESTPPRGNGLKLTWQNGDPGYHEPGYAVTSALTVFYYSAA